MAWYEKVEDNGTVWAELLTEDGLTYFYNTVTKETSWERPDELMTEEDKGKQGEWVWLPDKTDCYIPGKVTTQTNDQIMVETEYGEVHKFSLNTELEPLKWSSLQRITPDLVLLDSMSSPLILHNLKKRFESGNIYTNIGTICISINPYTPLDPPIYGASVINKYRRNLSDHKQMPPHVYCTGDNAYKGLTFKSGPNQSIIISGESGAGKTEAAKQVVNYVSSVAGSVSGIEDFLFLSNPILESFGNAKTVRNNNSSRFGKYMELNFTQDLKLCSAHITNYLLEKIRVPKPMQNERNYHIFYQLCHGDPYFVKEFALASPENFNYLAVGNCTVVDGIDDRADFEETVNAFKHLEFDDQQIYDIFRIVAGVLHLGNVNISQTGSTVEINPSQSFNMVSQLLGVHESEMNYRLTTRKMRIRGQEPIDVPLKPHEAVDAKDACSKFIYSNLFDWLVLKINDVMGKTKTKFKSIGILDIFGFEIFQENSFEQLCINFTNEQLQQIFNLTVFKREEKLYKTENISFDHVPFIDNEPIIKLIQDSPYGILNLLDEECRIPDGSEEKFLIKVSEAQKTCRYFELNERGKRDCFTLVHYAGSVTYSVKDFIEKNKDTLTQDLLEMVTMSEFQFLSNLFPKSTDESDRSRKATLGMQFKRQLNTLINTLNTTEPHYIRCIKPNEQKAPLEFISVNCNEQLTYAGVFEAVYIMKEGYPFHLRHSEFIERYGLLVGPGIQYGVAGCKQIIQHFNLSEENIKIGRTMVLYRANEHRTLELKRSIVVEKQELENNLQKILRENPDMMDNKEPYFEELAMLVRKAKKFKVESAVARQAEMLLEQFIEARIDPETKALVEDAFYSVDYDKLVYAVAIADQYNYQTKMCKNCRKLLHYITRIREEVDLALDVVDRKWLEVVVSAAESCGYCEERINSAKMMLSLDEEKFITEQIRASVRRKEFNRQIRLEIKIKEIIFERSGEMFSVKNYGNIKTADEWASEKLFGKEKHRMNFYRWQKDPIHSSLTKFAKEKVNKIPKKKAVSMFKNIMVFMGDKKPSKSQRFNKQVAIDILKECFEIEKLRNEFYLQLIKQLTNNPNQGSVKKGNDLMILGLNTFGPGSNFENHLYYYILKHAPVSDKQRFLIALQTIMLEPKKLGKIPDGVLFDDIVGGKNVLQPQFTDKVPPGAPSWQDLLNSWDEQDDDEDEIMFTATRQNLKARKTSKMVTMPKNTTLNKPVEPKEKVGGWGMGNKKSQTVEPKIDRTYSGPWVEYMDNESGYPYYYNTETEETTWEKPAEMP